MSPVSKWRRIAAIDDVDPGDALFWMGSPADGAAFLNELRSRLILIFPSGWDHREKIPFLQTAQSRCVKPIG